MTNPAEPNTDVATPVTAAAVKLVTATMAAVVGLTFLFGFVRHEALCFEWR